MKRLRDFIKEVMKQKCLKGLDIEKRSGGAIKDSYISDILSGKTKSISVEKLNALAKGLGVDAVELFNIATGRPYVAPEWTISAVLHALETITDDHELSEIVKALLKASPTKRKAILRSIQSKTD